MVSQPESLCLEKLFYHMAKDFLTECKENVALHIINNEIVLAGNSKVGNERFKDSKELLSSTRPVLAYSVSL